MSSHSPVAGQPVGPLKGSLRAVRRQLAAVARHGRWALQPDAFPRSVQGEAGPLYHVRKAPLGGEGDPALQAGKQHNVAVVAALLDGIALTPRRPFSFARAVGPITTERGFVAGRALLGGCLIPTVGGGMCVVTNTIFALAVELGWTILERHGHSLAHPDLPAVELDATVRVPDVDLRVAPDRPVVLRLAVEDDSLVVRVHADGIPPAVVVRRVNARAWVEGGVVYRADRVLRAVDGGPWKEVAVNRRRVVPTEQRHRSCWTCGETGCHERDAALKLR